MNGIRIFKTLEEAQAAGFAIFDRLPDGYLVRKAADGHFALALVKFNNTESEVPGKK